MVEERSTADEELIEGFHPDEFGYATWKELTPSFASGSLVYVSKDLDFKEAASAVESDDTNKVSAWMNDGLMHAVSDEQASKWTEESPVMFRFLIRQPLVLIQQIPYDPESADQKI